MSIIKSLSVGNGDMFYIKHNSDNFSIIDCCMNEDDKKEILQELKSQSQYKIIKRFISTHPDDDHIRGLKYLNQEMPILNFYCVKNEATKEYETTDFKQYCSLRDSSKAFYLKKGCSRYWMNLSSNERGQAGINVLWPVTNNQYYKDALQKAADGGSPNNISPIIQYSLESGVRALWMGDLETDFMENIGNSIYLNKIAGINVLWPVTNNQYYKDALQKAADGGSPNNISPIIQYSLESGVRALWMGDLETDFMENIGNSIYLNKIDIFFAPHHGRGSGKVPKSWLNILNPKIIVIGETSSEHLNYYSSYNTIKQNSAGALLFDCVEKAVRVYVKSSTVCRRFSGIRTTLNEN